jgi:hypothetical protein
VTQHARAWLPKEAFSQSAVKAALAASVARWSERWFARRQAVISAVRLLGEIPPDAPQALRIRGQAATAELTGRGKRVLLEAMLDADLSERQPGEGDHRVLETLAREALEDFVAALEESGSDGAGAAPWVSITVSLSGSDTLAAYVPASLVAALIKVNLRAPDRSRAMLHDRIAALGPMRVKTEGILGRVELGLSELKGLSTGDVLVLDRALGAPVDLRLCAGHDVVATGRLCRDGGQISIQL